MFARDDEGPLGGVVEIGVIFENKGMTAARVYRLV